MSENEEAVHTNPQRGHQGAIHPVVIYPYSHPKDTSHLERLYAFLKELDSKLYFRPLTVLNRQTIDDVKRSSLLTKENQQEVSEAFDEFIEEHVTPVSDIAVSAQQTPSKNPSSTLLPCCFLPQQGKQHDFRAKARLLATAY